MNIKSIVFIATIITAPLLFNGCMTQKKSDYELARISATEKLNRGKAHFLAGNYSQAETDLIGATIWQANNATQLNALKYLAFTYCVTERPALCRHAFYKALQLDPRFELSSAEVTHPLWGPEFNLARNGQPSQ